MIQYGKGQLMQLAMLPYFNLAAGIVLNFIYLKQQIPFHKTPLGFLILILLPA